MGLPGNRLSGALIVIGGPSQGLWHIRSDGCARKMTKRRDYMLKFLGKLGAHIQPSKQVDWLWAALTSHSKLTYGAGSSSNGRRLALDLGLILFESQ